MKVGITGTPGTGKTTVAEELNQDIIDLKQYAKDNNLGEQKELYSIDINKVKENLPENYWIEGHLAHKLDLDYCIILRTKPEVLRERLEKRGYPNAKIEENLEAEAMDLILSEASQKDFPIYEIDTTEKSTEEIAKEIQEAVKEKKERTGIVDWTDYLGL